MPVFLNCFVCVAVCFVFLCFFVRVLVVFPGLPALSLVNIYHKYIYDTYVRSATFVQLLDRRLNVR